jgi:hypothetical protein
MNLAGSLMPIVRQLTTLLSLLGGTKGMGDAAKKRYNNFLFTLLLEILRYWIVGQPEARA